MLCHGHAWWAFLPYAVLNFRHYLFYLDGAQSYVAEESIAVSKIDVEAKAEELNHAKLQFFTNITHELLTPLTIISATVDELKMQAPLHNDLYVVMNSNIQRLILLQQILESQAAT